MNFATIAITFPNDELNTVSGLVMELLRIDISQICKTDHIVA